MSVRFGVFDRCAQFGLQLGQQFDVRCDPGGLDIGQDERQRQFQVSHQVGAAAPGQLDVESICEVPDGGGSNCLNLSSSVIRLCQPPVEGELPGALAGIVAKLA